MDLKLFLMRGKYFDTVFAESSLTNYYFVEFTCSIIFFLSDNDFIHIFRYSIFRDFGTVLNPVCHWHWTYSDTYFIQIHIRTYSLASVQVAWFVTVSSETGRQLPSLLAHHHTSDAVASRVCRRHHWMYNATAFNHAYTDSGLFCIYSSAHPSQLRELCDVIVRELTAMAGLDGCGRTGGRPRHGLGEGF